MCVCTYVCVHMYIMHHNLKLNKLSAKELNNSSCLRNLAK